MSYCDLTDLPTENCDHCAAQAVTARTASVTTLQVSPKKVAHFLGCAAPGENPNQAKWARIEGPRLWQRLGNGEAIPATGGPNLNLVAEKRCADCVTHGPWE